MGYARSKLTLSELRSSFEKNCKLRDCDKEKYEEFIKRCSYISVFILKLKINIFKGQYDKDEGFSQLNKAIEQMEETFKSKLYFQ